MSEPTRTVTLSDGRVVEIRAVSRVELLLAFTEEWPLELGVVGPKLTKEDLSPLDYALVVYSVAILTADAELPKLEAARN